MHEIETNNKNKKLLIIFGPPAVGKLTVAEELSKITNFKVLNNHADIDILRPIFEFDSPTFKNLSRFIRKSIIEEAVKNNINLIFTYVWNLSREGGKKNIDLYKSIVEENGGTVYFVELFADLDTRLERSQEESRKKYTKIKDKDKMFQIHKEQQHNTEREFFYPELFFKIDNTNLSAEAVALKIKEYFNF